MKKAIIIFSAIALIASSCGTNKQETLESRVLPFIPEGYTVLFTASGNLNLDKYEDVILVVERKGEMGDFFQEEDRALLILLGQSGGKYKLAARNDKLVYNSYEGGTLGDAFQKVVINDGYFSVENMGGSREMWTRIITFKYSKEDKTWYLHTDGGDIIDRLDPDNMTTNVKTTIDFGKVAFEQFDRNKDYAQSNLQPNLITADGLVQLSKIFFGRIPMQVFIIQNIRMSTG